MQNKKRKKPWMLIGLALWLSTSVTIVAQNVSACRTFEECQSLVLILEDMVRTRSAQLQLAEKETETAKARLAELSARVEVSLAQVGLLESRFSDLQRAITKNSPWWLKAIEYGLPAAAVAVSMGRGH